MGLVHPSGGFYDALRRSRVDRYVSRACNGGFQQMDNPALPPVFSSHFMLKCIPIKNLPYFLTK